MPLLKKLKNILQFINKSNRAKAIEAYEWEEEELKNTFALLVCGSFLGHPSPPMHITIELLPEMEEDLKVMLDKLDLSRNPLSEMFSSFDIG